METRAVEGELHQGGGRRSVVPADVREAALTSFAQRGYHGTTMNEIAESLGIRAPSLYNHISSKQELLVGIMVETMEGVLADFETAMERSGDVVEQLREAVRVYVLRHIQHPREALIVNREVSSLEEPDRRRVRLLQARHARAVRDLIRRGVEEGALSTRSATLAAFAILEMGVSVARWFRGEGRLSADEVADLYAEFAVRLAGGST